MVEPTRDHLKMEIAAPAARAEQSTFRGWQALRLSNNLVEAVIVPAIGGRVMAFNLGGYAYLWVNPALEGRLFSEDENQGDGTLAAWKNYGGSKTWPAPQGWENEDQWHGPPDGVLDTGRYTLEECGVRAGAPYVRVSSPDDPRTGIQITRQLTLQPTGARAVLHLEMENRSQQPRCWGLWDVVQLDATRQVAGGQTHQEAARVYIPANPNSVFPRGYQVMFGAQDNPEWQPEIAPGIIGAQYLFQVGKIGVDSQAGWLAFVNHANDFTFIQRFEVFPNEIYPDGGATVECWTTGLGESVGGLDYARDPLYHVEAEVLGPLRRMLPGERQTVDIEWCACRCPGPIVHVTPAGCIHQPLSVHFAQEGVRLSGVYGVFAPGSVRLDWLDGNGGTLRAETVALAHPLDVLQLNLARPAPVGWKSAALYLVEEDGQAGLLDRVEKLG